MHAEEMTLDIPGLTLSGLAWGPADGKPLLAIHGWLDNGASYARLAPLLEGYRVVALDLPGHGRSDHRAPGVPYHFVDWVVDVGSAADALGWDRFTLIGHSMGAGVASLVAGTFPSRIERLVLIEGLGAMACAPEDAPERLARSAAQRVSRESRQPRPHDDLEAAAVRLRAANQALSLEAARILVERGTRQTDEGVVWSSDSRLRGLSPMRITEAHIGAFLGRIACPTLLLIGDNGYPFDPALLETRLGRIRLGQQRTLPGSHHLHLEDPAPVAAAIQAFLDEDSEAELEQPLAERGAEAAARVRLLILDVDGVLTDGGLSYGPDGLEIKRFNVKDGLGIKLLQKAGIEVAILSGRASPAVERRAAELGIKHVLLGIGDKGPALTGLLEATGVADRDAAYMGDDLPDLGCLRRVGFAVTPADARPELRRHAHLITQAAGGQGAVRELAEHLLRAQGRWNALLSQLSGNTRQAT
jgi:YrbI family 3-deoxy-D-manno-octulosonate 8-phosphate phosphatase